MATILVEFYGIPRRQAGVAFWRVNARTPREALAAVAGTFPALSGVLTPAGRLGPHYLISRAGESFIDDLDAPLHADIPLLLLSADAGG